MSYLDDLEKLSELKKKKLITAAEFEVQKAHLLKQGRTPTDAANNVPAGSKSRITYVLLALFFGALGIHNFYAGRIGCAIGQLILGTIGWILFLGWITWIWAFIDIFAVKTDGTGKALV